MPPDYIDNASPAACSSCRDSFFCVTLQCVKRPHSPESTTHFNTQHTDLQNISLHIEYLLRTHDCVILPGVGAFLRTRRAALFDEEDRSITPPALQICFNSSIVVTDGLLANSVQRRNKISFEEASVIVSNAAEQCRNALANAGEVTIGKLGILTADLEGRISFHPYKPIFNGIWKPVYTHHNTSAQTDRDRDRDETTALSRPDHRFYTIRIPRKLIRYAAILAVCLLTTTTLLPPSAPLSKSNPVQYASVVPVVEKLSSPVNNDNSSDAIDTDSIITGDIVEATPKYYLIVATFTNEADCQKFIDSRPDTPTPLQTVCNGKVCRVYSAASDSKDELKQVMTSKTHTDCFSASWIWTDPTAI